MTKMATKFFTHESRATDCIIPSFPFMEARRRKSSPPAPSDGELAASVISYKELFLVSPQNQNRAPSLPQHPAPHSPLAFATRAIKRRCKTFRHPSLSLRMPCCC